MTEGTGAKGRGVARSIAGVLGLLVVIVLIPLVLTVLTSNETAIESPSTTTGLDSAASRTTTTQPRGAASSIEPIEACRLAPEIAEASVGDFDGDGEQDLAWHHWVDEDKGGGPVLEVCLATGRHDERPGLYMTEGFEVLDIQGDGRDEIFYGGNSVSLNGGRLATVARGKLFDITLPDGSPLEVEFGLDYRAGGRSVAREFGCDDHTGDNKRELDSITLRLENGAYRWVQRTYEIRGATATLLTTRSGGARPPKKPQPWDRVAAAKEIVGYC